MKSILTLVLLSMFMAQPSFAMRTFIEEVNVTSIPSTGPVDHYIWGIIIDGVTSLQNTTSTPSTVVMPDKAPYGTIFKLIVWPLDILNRYDYPSNESEEGRIFPDFDYDHNGVVGISDFGTFRRLWFTLANFGLFRQVFSSCVIGEENKEYVKCS